MAEVLTVCPFCGCGCGLYLRAEEGRVSGVFPSSVHPVSQGRLCTKGWHAHELPLSPWRLDTPLVRKNGKLTPATWSQALDEAAQGLDRMKQSHGSQALAALGSSRCTNEANYLLMRLARQVLGTNNVDFSGRPDGLLSWTAAACGIAGIDEADFLLLVETDGGDEHPAISARLLRARRRGAKIVAIGLRSHRLARLADVHLQALPGHSSEVIAGIVATVFTNSSKIPSAEKAGKPFFLRVPEFTPEMAAAAGVKMETMLQAAALFAACEKPLALIGQGAYRYTGAEEIRRALSGLFDIGREMGKHSPGGAEGGGILLGARGNTRGALEMGVAPDLLPGYQPVAAGAAREAFAAAWKSPLPEQPGLSLREMRQSVRALLVMADAPLFFQPEQRKVKELLQGLEFLVVQDSISGELLEKADVVLPAAAFGEEDGTFTSLEGRVQRTRKAVSPPGEARPHYEILGQLARRLGTNFGYAGPAEIMQEIAALTPRYERVSYQVLEGAPGMLLPTPNLPAEENPSTAPAQPPTPAHDPAFPYLLVADYSSSWEGDPAALSCCTLRGEFTIQMKDWPGGFVEMNPQDAESLGLRPGARVRVEGEKGEFAATLRISAELPAGVAAVPFRQAEQAGAVLAAETGAAWLGPAKVRIEALRPVR